MTFIRSRVLRTVGVACAASMMLVALPVGMANAAGPRADASALPTLNDPKIEARLKAAPELEGATFDLSGLKFAPGGITAENQKFTSTGRSMMTDHTLDNPLNPDDKDQQTLNLTTVQQSHQRTNTFSWTRTNEFGTSLAVGYQFQWGVSFLGFSGQHQLSTSLTLDYGYSSAEQTTTSETYTITAWQQTVPVRPGHSVQVLQYVDVGKFEADLTLHGSLRGDVIVNKCGRSRSIPIGQLAALARDPGQGPLIPDAKSDGDVLRQTATVHWSADMATKAYTTVSDTIMDTGYKTTKTTPIATDADKDRSVTKSRRSATPPTSAPYTHLRDLVNCAPPSVRQFAPSMNGTWVAFDSDLFDSKSRVIVWVNGQYKGETYNGLGYYGAYSATHQRRGTYAVAEIPTSPGDLVQVGIVPGYPGWGFPPPEKSQLIGVYRVESGVETAVKSGNSVAMTQTSALLNSDANLVVWINGVYAGETARGTAYYGSAAPLDVSEYLVNWGIRGARYGDLVQIGIRPPGAAMTPEASKLVYQAIL